MAQWTNEMDQFIIDGKKDGLSSSQILQNMIDAGYTDLTRNSIAGRANRLGIGGIINNAKRKHYLPPVVGHAKTCQYIGCTELKPIDGIYCGRQSINNSSYCDYHHNICYRKTKGKNDDESE